MKKFHFRLVHWRTTEITIRGFLVEPRASRFISGARRTNAELRKCVFAHSHRQLGPRRTPRIANNWPTMATDIVERFREAVVVVVTRCNRAGRDV